MYIKTNIDTLFITIHLTKSQKIRYNIKYIIKNYDKILKVQYLNI